MKSRLYIICIVIILFIISFLQADFFYSIRIFDSHPDFLLVICGLLGFYIAEKKYNISFWCSVFAGVSAGSFSSCNTILFVLIYSISSFLGFILKDDRYKRYSSSPWFLFVFSCLISLISSIVYLIVLFFVNKLSLLNIFFYFAAQCFFNSIIIYPFSCLIRLFTRSQDFDFR